MVIIAENDGTAARDSGMVTAPFPRRWSSSHFPPTEEVFRLQSSNFRLQPCLFTFLVKQLIKTVKHAHITSWTSEIEGTTMTDNQNSNDARTVFYTLRGLYHPTNFCFSSNRIYSLFEHFFSLCCELFCIQDTILLRSPSKQLY